MMTDRAKFKIYVRPGGMLKVKSKGKLKPRNPSAVAFVLRHLIGRTYEDQCSEMERLLKIVDHTADDRRAIEQVLQIRCRTSQ